MRDFAIALITRPKNTGKTLELGSCRDAKRPYSYELEGNSDPSRATLKKKQRKRTNHRKSKSPNRYR